jgi:hypothetical protein
LPLPALPPLAQLVGKNGTTGLTPFSGIGQVPSLADFICAPSLEEENSITFTGRDPLNDSFEKYLHALIPLLCFLQKKTHSTELLSLQHSNRL